MSKLFNVSVKYERGPRERKWTVFRYAVVAETAEVAERLVREEHGVWLNRKVIDVFAREIEGGCLPRDNYPANNGNPFDRNHKPLGEGGLFAEG